MLRISRWSKLLDTPAARQFAIHGTGLTSYLILMALGIFRETTAADLIGLMVIDQAPISRSVPELLAQGLLKSTATAPIAAAGCCASRPPGRRR